MSVYAILKMFLTPFIFFTGSASTTLNPLLFGVTIVVCTVDSSTTSKSSSCVTLPATGDVGCGVGEDGSHSAPQQGSNDFPPNTHFVIGDGNH